MTKECGGWRGERRKAKRRGETKSVADDEERWRTRKRERANDEKKGRAKRRGGAEGMEQMTKGGSGRQERRWGLKGRR